MLQLVHEKTTSGIYDRGAIDRYRGNCNPRGYFNRGV